MATITILQNTALPVAATAGRTSTVGEPSLSNADQDVFFTGNWYASQSPDHGATWTLVDPFSTFPPIDGGFCCDQTAIFVPQANLTVWLLQYSPSATSNVMRIAARAPGGAWRFWDIRPTTVNASFTNQWFDYNSAAFSDNFLYVTNNMYTIGTRVWTRAVVLRIRLTDLLSTAPLPFQSFSTTQNGSLRCTLGARSVMYFGSHNSASQIRLFTWPESSTAVTTQNVSVARWNDSTPYSARCPDGNEWLSRADGRITAAWTGAGEIGFAWTSNRMGGQRPFPFVRAVRLNESTKSVIAQPDLWNPNFAYALPDVCPNANGVPGMSVFLGGGTKFPSHAIGVLDAGAWNLLVTRSGTNAPSDGKWGDYVTCRRHSPDDTSWIASGYTLQGSPLRSAVEPRFVHFRI